jgi:hypothetical protein
MIFWCGDHSEGEQRSQRAQYDYTISPDWIEERGIPTGSFKRSSLFRIHSVSPFASKLSRHGESQASELSRL